MKFLLPSAICGLCLLVAVSARPAPSQMFEKPVILTREQWDKFIEMSEVFIEPLKKFFETVPKKDKDYYQAIVNKFFSRNANPDEIIEMVEKHVEKKLDEEKKKTYKSIIEKCNDVLKHYDEKIMPTLKPRTQKFIKDMENLYKNFFQFLDKSAEERHKQLKELSDGLTDENFKELHDSNEKFKQYYKDSGFLDEIKKLSKGYAILFDTTSN